MSARHSASVFALSLALAVVAIAPAGARDALPPLGALSADGAWEQLPAPPRGGHTVVRDPARDRLILFGGNDPVLRGDLWWMPGDGSSGWSPLPATGPGPQRREHHTAIFDAPRDRMLVFGGDSGAAGDHDRSFRSIDHVWLKRSMKSPRPPMTIRRWRDASWQEPNSPSPSPSKASTGTL